MKKIISLALLVAVSVNSFAQNVNDALRFSTNDYYGTARSMAMGSAFTALGGDLGSVSINPAGSAVNNYSQIVISPSVSISSNNALFAADGYVGDGGSSDIKSSSRSTKMTMPNFGFMLNMNTNQKRGLKAFTFGFVGNSTSYFNNDLEANGDNQYTSYMGYLAALASSENMTLDELNKASYWDMGVYYWPAMVGYRSGMINETGNGDYVGAAQGITSDGYPVRGVLDQRYSRSTQGNKYDMVINMGFNFNDRLYFGLNLGMVELAYRSKSMIKERALHPNDFPVTIGGKEDHFNSMSFYENYTASGSGVYAKFGFIAIPTEGLRIGAAIQTPVANHITETLWYSGETQFDNAVGNESIKSKDEYIYDFNFTSPYRINAGVAYTIPGFGLLSADYEFCDYSTMKFKEADSIDNSGFDESNKSIQDGAGASHIIRLGAEYLPHPNYSLRAGYNFISTAERYINESGVKVAPEAFTQSFAIGAGYKSSKSFFLDAALRCKVNANEYIYPYPSYDEFDSPEILNKSRLWDAVLTFGWRF